jgi:hypothetical protein
MTATINGEKIQVVKTDTDGLYYRREDTRWLCEPTDEDPGVLGAVEGAESIDEEFLN